MVLPDVVSPEEPLGRYLPEDTYFSHSRGAVKPKAFMPTRALILSVFRIDGLKWKEIWEIGQREVIDAMHQSKVLYGIASIKVYKVQEKDLIVDPDNKPLRHANIIGWPEEKGRQHSIAQELAAEAKLVLKN